MGQWETAVSLLDEMESNGHEISTSFFFISFFFSFFFNFIIFFFFSVESLAPRLGTVMFNGVLVACCEANQLDAASRVFQQLSSNQKARKPGAKPVKLNASSYNIMLNALYRNGWIAMSLQLYDEGIKGGHCQELAVLREDKVTKDIAYKLDVHGCSLAVAVVAARRLLQKMADGVCQEAGLLIICGMQGSGTKKATLYPSLRRMLEASGFNFSAAADRKDGKDGMLVCRRAAVRQYLMRLRARGANEDTYSHSVGTVIPAGEGTASLTDMHNTDTQMQTKHQVTQFKLDDIEDSENGEKSIFSKQSLDAAITDLRPTSVSQVRWF